MKNTKLFKLLVSTFLIVIITAACFEVTIIVLLNNPSLLTGGLKTIAQQFYMNVDRKIIQFLPECSRYDESLSYMLKPGECRFKNREFDVEVSANSAGFRDKESDLNSPQVVVLGDSHALGWGVSQESMFPSLLEKELGKTVLTTAMSSYGTVRELKTLKRVNLDKMETLVIQYCQNDIFENGHFYIDNNSLEIMSKESYLRTVEKHKNDTDYYFGKYVVYAASSLFQQIYTRLFPESSENDGNNKSPEELPPESELFINALKNSPVDISKAKIIVFEINGKARNDDKFINSLKSGLQKDDLPNWMKNIITVDMSPYLTEDLYFTLDDHSRPEAHQIIAKKLAEIISTTSSTSMSKPR